MSTSSEEGGDRAQIQYRMEGLPNLDNMTCRHSKHNKLSLKKKALENPTVNNFFGLFTMFSMFTVAALTSSVSYLPISLGRGVVFHTEKVKSNLDSTLSCLKFTALLTSAIDNISYTCKETLQQPDNNEFVLTMMGEMETRESRNYWIVRL